MKIYTPGRPGHSWGSRVDMLGKAELDLEPVLAVQPLGDERCAECDCP